ncbi:MAG: HEAT repeat domain-containing protein [Gemmatimonadota bacterium]
MDRDALRERVLSYLYGLLDEAEAADLRADLGRNPELARLLAEEERLHRRLPVGAGAEVPDALLQESRLLLRAALRRDGRRAPPLAARIWAWLQEGVPRLALAGGAVAALLLGAFLGRAAGPFGGPAAPSALPGQVVDLRVSRFDPATGQVDLELTALTTTSLQGTVGDPRVQAVLAAALVGPLGPGPRLEAAQLLRRQSADLEVRQALTHALLHDPNPGVRLAATEALKGRAGDEPVRRGLQQALLQDDNPGVRIAAVEALQGLRDPGTRQTLERSAEMEANPYIRAEARRALSGGPAPSPARL